jgi:hypothetical protein
MYIERLRLENVRTFVDETLDFVHPDRTFRPRKRANENGSLLLPRPRLPNVNLLLGDHGSGVGVHGPLLRLRPEIATTAA